MQKAMSNQKDDEAHCFQLQYQTTPNISDVEGLSFQNKTDMEP